RFAVFTVCWTILLFVAGALVTSKDAALSVTDWPKSHGVWVPALSSLQGGDFFEFSHRFAAGGLGVFTLLVAMLLVVKEARGGGGGVERWGGFGDRLAEVARSVGPGAEFAAGRGLF